ncbi:MAG TPA: alpha/beta hydrolase [Solirubrobacterales bacterium]|nr:alpha/beta hydrolase [Solirubrobacterales bacterium]
MPVLAARGVELAWTERGQGPPALLVHETAASADVWDQVAGDLSASARAIAYDRRGWGSSSAPDEYRRTTVEEQSEDAAALIESLDAGPAALCAAGVGAVIALDLLLRRPELVSGAVLIEPPLLQLLPTATEALSDDRLRLETVAGEGRNVIDLYLSGGLPALGAGVTRIPEGIAAHARERPASVIAELGLPAGWRMPLPRLASAERRSLIVVSQSTPPLLRAAAEALAGRLAESSLREVDSGRQAPHVGAPAVIAALVTEQL